MHNHLVSNEHQGLFSRAQVYANTHIHTNTHMFTSFALKQTLCNSIYRHIHRMSIRANWVIFFCFHKEQLIKCICCSCHHACGADASDHQGDYFYSQVKFICHDQFNSNILMLTEKTHLHISILISKLCNEYEIMIHAYKNTAIK